LTPLRGEAGSARFLVIVTAASVVPMRAALNAAPASPGEPPPVPPEPTPRPATTDLASPRLLRWLFTAARLAMLIGIVSLLVAAVTLLVFGAVSTFQHVALLTSPAAAELANRDVFFASIKLMDLVLLATILQVVAFGLYALFIDSRIDVPQWLRSEDVDSLKAKLAGIVVVMLGVLFLEEVIHFGSGRDLLPFGIAVAAVVVALSYFIVAHPKKE
jgi:uncharacterized membrane protein YqhA